MTRTQDEIVNRINELDGKDFFGFERQNLIEALDFEHAKSFLKEDVTEKNWDYSKDKHANPEYYRDQIREYLDFAIEKANNERGLSAGRSQDHFRSWMWLAGDDDILKLVEAAAYAPYGKPKLDLIIQHYKKESVVSEGGGS